MSKKAEISARQKKILDYINTCVEKNHVPPSVREIGEAVGLSSPSSVHVHLRVLEEKGYITRQGAKSRSMVLTEKGLSTEGVSSNTASKGHRKEPSAAMLQQDSSSTTLPLVGRVAAGSPILAEQNIEEEITLPISLVGDQGSFLLTVHGNSMIDAGIFDGDIVIVKEQASASDGDIVVALLEDGATVKTYYKEKDCIRLQPQNPALEPIFTRDVAIVGVVTGLFRSLA